MLFDFGHLPSCDPLRSVRSVRTVRCALRCAFPLALGSALLFAVLPAPWLVLLVVAPAVEETVFRAGLQEALLNHRWLASAMPWVANALTASAFALAHVTWHAGQGAWLTVLPALCTGALYQRTRRLVPCIALHGFFNAVWLAAAGLPA